MANTFDHGYALIIGVDDNNLDALKLPAVAHDVEALHKVLADPEHCAYASDNVLRITGQDATKANIIKGITWLGDKLAKDDSFNTTAVIYFSGHGHRDAKDYYMLPYDIKMERLRTTAILATEFNAFIAELKPKRLLILLDCCQAGGIGDGAKGAAVQAPVISVPPPLEVFMTDEPMPDTPASAPGAKGVAEALAQDRGRVIISSSQGEQKSYVLKSGKMSVFTYHLVQALIGHASSTQLASGEFAVAVFDVAKYVSAMVPKTVSAEYGAIVQQPEFNIKGMNFPLALVHGGAGYGKGVDLPDAIATVEAAPQPASPTISQVVTNGKNVIQQAGNNNKASIKVG